MTPRSKTQSLTFLYDEYIWCTNKRIKLRFYASENRELEFLDKGIESLSQTLLFLYLHSLKYLRSKTSGFKDKEIRKSDLLAKTQFL